MKPAIPFIALLGWWLAAKCYLFSRLSYSIDMAVSLSLSRSLFMDGRLLYDPNWGFHSAIHNSYTILLFAPLTLIFDAPGLFVGMALVEAVALFVVFRTPTISTRQKVFIAACLTGPLGYFVYDDPLLGFHPEQLLVPLTLLLAVAIGHRHRGAVTVCAILLFLTKETGALALASVWLIWRGLDAWPAERWTPHAVGRLTGLAARAALLTVVISALSALLLWVNQQWFGGRAPAATRVAIHLGDLVHAAGGAAYWRDAVWVLGGMVASCLTALAWRQRAFRLAPLLTAAIVPLLAAAMIGDAGYHMSGLPTGVMGAYRLATVWGIALAALYLSMLRGPASETVAPARDRPSRFALAVAVTLAAQLIILAATTSERPWARWLPWWFESETTPLTLSADERRAVDCLSNAAPRGSTVVADAFLAAPLDHTATLFFESYNPRHDAPVLIMCANSQRPWRLGCSGRLRWARSRERWTSGDVGSIAFAATPRVFAAARPCLPAPTP